MLNDEEHRDGYLDSAEMFAYISRNNSNSETGTKTDKIRYTGYILSVPFSIKIKAK
jgi:hypothetical protein